MSERGRRLAKLLLLEVDRITRDLPERREFLVSTWSRLRSREAFEHTLFTRWRMVAPADLLELPEGALEPLHRFYEVLGDLQLYLRLTEDMPQTLGDYYDRAAADLLEVAEAVRAALQ